MAKMLIAGKWFDSYDGATIDAVNPATSEVLDTFPRGGREDARAAIDAAYDARGKAEAMTAYERSTILLKASQILEQRSTEMARIISQNVGKPITDAEAETTRGCLTLAFAAEEAKRIYGQTIPLDSSPFPPGNKDRFGFTVREPIGVVGAISPFNFPLNLLLHKVAPALAAGNTVVIKPPSDGPLPGIMAAKILEEAGLPPGIVNLVTGPGSTVGEEIVTNPKVDAISFTGDTSTGRMISEKAAATNKKLILELGGHDPMIILDDADLTRAAKLATTGVFSYSGQVCTATKRIIVSEAIKDKFASAFVQEVQKLKVGNPLERTTNMGPVINAAGLSKVQELVEDATSNGAVVLLGGQRLDSEAYSKGFFYSPTVLSNVRESMKITQQEIFGPVAPILEVGDAEEAVDVANNTVYGLQASIFTSNLARGIKLARKIRAGAVLINDRTNMRWDNAPFGGVKRSGLGREGVSLAVTEFTELKFIVANLTE